jgi:hypothetical protein
MTWKAQFYIGLIIAAGGGLIASCLATGTIGYSDAYLVYCLFAWASSALKVRLPGITGTMSMNFLFVLVSIAVFTLLETVLLAVVACVIQCYVKAKRRPRLIQVAFNVATWAISTGMAYRVSHWFAAYRGGELIVLLPVAACLFFFANTFLVSGVLSLVEHKPLFDAWQQCYLWTLPYYLAGSVIAGLAVQAGERQGWAASLAVLPVMYLL